MDEHTKHHIKESPKNVVYPLAVLAGLSTIGGLIGMPGWTGLSNKFEHFLEPVLRVPESAEPVVHHTGQELLFTALSIGIAVLGIIIAYRFYVVKPGTADRITDKIRGFYRLVYRKYFVDEIYDALFVNRVKNLGNGLYFMDAKFVDGAVNGTATSTRGISTLSKIFDIYVVDGLVNLIGKVNMGLNRVATSFQTGIVQRYALISVFGIAAFIVIYYSGLF